MRWQLSGCTSWTKAGTAIAADPPARSSSVKLADVSLKASLPSWVSARVVLVCRKTTNMCDREEVALSLWQLVCRLLRPLVMSSWACAAAQENNRFSTSSDTFQILRHGLPKSTLSCRTQQFMKLCPDGLCGQQNRAWYWRPVRPSLELCSGLLRRTSHAGDTL